MKRLVRRFNQDEKASIAHALMHLEANKIADDDYHGHSGWYCGNREQFVKRHKKAVALMRSLLAPNIPICVKSGAERDGDGDG